MRLLHKMNICRLVALIHFLQLTNFFDLIMKQKMDAPVHSPQFLNSKTGIEYRTV